jgi:hypothetical protein
MPLALLFGANYGILLVGTGMVPADLGFALC